jgi:hypothetical protein
MKIWAQRDIWYFLVETKWKGLHFTLAGGSLTAFGGQIAATTARRCQASPQKISWGPWRVVGVSRSQKRIFENLHSHKPHYLI